MKAQTIFTFYRLGDITLENRIIMAPMTRKRANINSVPNELMKEYYAQRTSAGLIITEGTAISLNGRGYVRMPGIYTQEQIDGWRKITEKVHKNGGKIFVQLMHTGRIANYLNMFGGGSIIAPSAIAANVEVFTDINGKQPCQVPEEMTIDSINDTIQEFVQAAKNAVAAGFDGVELQAANGYLLEQFIAPSTNIRTDEYGSGIKNRCRFVLETVEAVCNAIGANKTGIRLSPYGQTNDIVLYPETEETYLYLSEKLQSLNVVYIHLVDHKSLGRAQVPDKMKREIRYKFLNTLILSGNYTLMNAEKDLNEGMANLIAFGRPFIGNPDLVERFKKDLPLNTNIDTSTFLTSGRKGYTDYPNYHESINFKRHSKHSRHNFIKEGSGRHI